ncbi:MAG: hypothetical protein RIF33_12870 [Cyclobacteriaceae bacterium]
MKVAIIAPHLEFNTLIKEQYEAFINAGISTYWGLDFFWERSFDADIYLIHWPELIFPNRTSSNPSKSDLDALERRLRELKSNSKIAVVYHNEYPHYRRSTEFDQLYDLIYSSAHAIIHLGNHSVELLTNKMKPNCIDHIVIPHPTYSSVPNHLTKEEARETLGINDEEKVMLVFGSLRNKEELKLVLQPFANSNIKKRRLLIVSNKLLFYTSLVEKYYSRIYIKYFSSSLKYVRGPVKNEEIQQYMNAADVVFVARKYGLNSGIVPLAFTFGKTVVGPAIGNIRELLYKTGNPTYNPYIPETIRDAIEDGFLLSESSQGEFNRCYAEGQMNQAMITKSYLKIFKKLSPIEI